MKLPHSFDALSTSLGATSVGFRCLLATFISGSIGMGLGDLAAPLGPHVVHHGDIIGLVFSGMTAGMLLFCIPACLFACRKRCQALTGGRKAILHLVGKATMMAGMIAGFLWLPHTHQAASHGGTILSHGYMIMGMTAGSGLGYGLAFFILVTLQSSIRAPLAITSPRTPILSPIQEDSDDRDHTN